MKRFGEGSCGGCGLGGVGVRCRDDVDAFVGRLGGGKVMLAFEARDMRLYSGVEYSRRSYDISTNGSRWTPFEDFCRSW